ncbi:monocarboxylate transporter 13-like [Ixodes scapularis]
MGADKRKEQSLLYQDSRWSWIMALVCSWCFFWALIINRCGGIVFITMISEMGASRQLASWPFSLLGTVSQLVGLVWGALVKCFPVRTVAVAGSVLAASGILFCVVFYNVTAMIIGLGVITALGQGLMFPSLLVVLNTYFKRFRASGMGICYAGGTLVSLMFPPLLLHLHEAYGLRGTLLILSACSLHVTAGCLLAKKPNDRPRPKSPVEEPLNTNQGSGGHDKAAKSKGTLISMRKELSFLKNAMYFVVVATSIVYTYNLNVFNVTIVDFAIGRGFSKWEAALLLPSYGTGDLLGRILSGQLSDRKILQRRDVMAASFLVLSASFVALVYSRSLVMLGTTSLVFGMASGSIIILFTVLLVEYFGLEKLPMTIGFISLVIGLATLPRPLLIGHYRDRGQSYESLYVLLAAMSFGICIVWVIECIRQWIASRKLNHIENLQLQQATTST